MKNQDVHLNEDKIRDAVLFKWEESPGLFVIMYIMLDSAATANEANVFEVKKVDGGPVTLYSNDDINDVIFSDPNLWSTWEVTELAIGK